MTLWVQLSGGEQQRVAIARAFLKVRKDSGFGGVIRGWI